MIRELDRAGQHAPPRMVQLTAVLHAPEQLDQLGQQECAQLFAYLVHHVPSQAAVAAADDISFLRSLPIFPAVLPGRRMSLDASDASPAFCPPAALAALAGSLAELPEDLQVRPKPLCAEPLAHLLSCVISEILESLFVARYVAKQPSDSGCVVHHD